jgi:hypothetical protein
MFIAAATKVAMDKIANPHKYGLYTFWIRGDLRTVRYGLEVLDRERSMYTVAKLVRTKSIGHDTCWQARIICWH